MKRRTDMEVSPTAEHQRLTEDATRTKNWKRWGPYFPNGNGPLFAKIIRLTEIAGIIFRTIMREAARIAGAKMDCSASLIGNAASVSHLRFGTVKTRF